MTFRELNLNTPLLNALDDLKLEHQTTIQNRAFPVVMSGRDMVGLAQTGTGKTFAYLLPMLRMLKFSKQREPRILIVVPTRELVTQVVQEAIKLTKYMTVRIGGVYGGTSMVTQSQMVYNGLDIVVATPGRFIDLVMNGSLKLKEIKQLVIDEVDEMLDLGFRPQLDKILELLPPKRQNLLFSATMTKEVEGLINKYFDDPQKIEAAAQGTVLEKIILQGYAVPNFNTKVNLLVHLLETNKEMSKVLVFTSSKRMADLLHERIDEKFAHKVGLIHSNRSQNNRFNSLIHFEDGTNRILIATDLVARGIDITDVTHVINFDVPADPPLYIHRIGRTGRADKGGVAITFITKKEEQHQQAIEDLMKKKIPMLTLPPGLTISDELIEEERPVIYGSSSGPKITSPRPSMAFQEKSKKNKKVNLGGSYKREVRKKYSKPKTRRGKKRRD